MIRQQTMTTRAWVELCLLSLVWGGSFMAFRVMLDELGVFTTAFHRVFWAALLLWVILLVGRYEIPKGAKIWAAFLTMGMLNNVIPFSLIAWGQLTVETGLASIFNASTALFGIPVAALFFADERLTGRKIIGITLGFLGCAYAIGFENLFKLDPRSIAQLAFLGACFSYAIAGSWARLTMGHLPPIVAATGMLTGSSVILFVIAHAIEGSISIYLEPATWAGIFYASVFATAIAYLLYYRVLAMAGSGNLMMCTLLIPPVAIIIGAVLRAEVLNQNAYIGFAILSVGLLIIDGRVLSALRKTL